MFVFADKQVPGIFIDLERELLNSIVEKNRFDFQKKVVQKASQRMDQVILYWYRKTDKKRSL